MAMIKVVLFLGNDYYYNFLTFLSDDYEALNEIRIAIDTAGGVYDEKEFPLIHKKHMTVYKEVYDKYKHFFFRTLHDNDLDIFVEQSVAFNILSAFEDNSLSIVFENHPCAWVRLISKYLSTYPQHDFLTQSFDSPNLKLKGF